MSAVTFEAPGLDWRRDAHGPSDPRLGLRRCLGWLGALAVAAALALCFLGPQSSSRGGPKPGYELPGARPVASRVWVVQPGQTLWGIATALEPHADVRPLVERLVAETGSATVYPGEAIPIP